ncbi:hypothetical protein CTA2_4444 [Colletotrichum tanaceti]|uniref:Heterokaryon incompatibility domain-containing protein n=1 Tax=Colletotrichum tanaceti TaxID=1306861 RepID=A0A4U6XSL0_9PEZI|nr:hypothetical protein CTA2_4444 [Colletotrichum tanaceti]TKW58821.1 hypothetical protein CTA1_8636 [Colletotrichum tanaceti]
MPPRRQHHGPNHWPKQDQQYRVLYFTGDGPAVTQQLRGQPRRGARPQLSRAPRKPKTAHARYTSRTEWASASPLGNPGVSRTVCALSYCWGNVEAHRTTRGTLKSHLGSIPCEKLPRTLSEAIHVTRELGIPYLWIDSLCIIQEDEQDWKKEAAQMGAVYSDAHVVITAAALDTSHGGLFRDRDEASVRPVLLTASSPPAPRSKSRRYVVPSGGDWEAASYSPITNRAWPLQEDILGARILSFRADQLSWACLSMMATEVDPDGAVSERDRSSAAKRAERQSIRLRSLRGVLPGPTSHTSTQENRPASVRERDVRFQVWEKVVQQYSSRAITMQTDRIPVILGVGRRLEANLHDSFVAGIWRGAYCLRSLGWQAEAPGDLVAHYPSWSWASTTSRVSYSMLSGPGAGEATVDYQASVVHFDGPLSED